MRPRELPATPPASRLVVALAAVLLAAGCQPGDRVEAGRPADPALAVDNAPVATIDGVPITRGELARRIREVTGGDAGRSDPLLQARILDQLVTERILLAEAARRGLSMPPADVEAAARAAEAAMGSEALGRKLETEGITPGEWRARLGETLLIRTLLATVPPPRPITEHDVRTYFEAHRAELTRPEQFRVRIITARTRKEADQVRAQLVAGADFAALARARSISPEKDAGGDLGFVPAGRLPPEFDEALVRLVPGELSPVVESPYGFHVLRLEERRQARQARLEEVRDEIRETLARNRLEAAQERWLADLRGKAAVEILDPELRDAQ